MADNALELFIAVFANETEAGGALNDFKQMQRQGSIDLIDAAVIVHDAKGKVHLEETADPSGKKLAKRGAVVGGLIGLIFPPSIIASAAVVGAGGGVWGKIRDKGFKDEDLKAVGDSLPAGSSAIIAIAEDRVLEQLENGINGYEKIARHALSAEAAAEIIADVSSDDA
jgi:uncharacterized membrane protein